MAPRIRRDVYSLPADDQTIHWYRTAVAALVAEPVANPVSWAYLASVHGLAGFPPPPGSGPYWDKCEHATWLFLPWHRGYVAAFEAVIAARIVELGGPEDWALPYWNYSEPLSSNPEARHIPPGFRDPALPDGQRNWLFARRAVDAQGRVAFRDQDVDLGALNQLYFTPPSGMGTGFGGVKPTPSVAGRQFGALESTPHNIVHVQIGGWMSDTRTAALDPIFWLHHCNIDRLWSEWLAMDPNHQNPDQPDWLTGTVFDMHDGAGQPFTYTSQDMLDTTQVMHGYVYDTLPMAQATTPPVAKLEMTDIAIEPELVGTSDGPVPLDGDSIRASVTLRHEERRLTEGAAGAMRVYMRLEDVRGQGTPGSFDVLIGLRGQDRRLFVGTLSTFGIAEASNPAREHGGNGITQLFDISDAARELGLTSGEASQIEVDFRHVAQLPLAESAFPPAPFEPDLPKETPQVEVGRIAVYFE